MYSIEVQIDAIAELVKDEIFNIYFIPGSTERAVVVTTWITSFLGYARSALIVSQTRDTIKKTIDEFVYDYLAANPKN